MSLAAACGWTLLRSTIVAAICVPVCWALRRQLASLGGHARLGLWVLLLVPFFVPALLAGYAWSNFALSLVRFPLWNEVLYSTLLVLRFVPVGVVLMWLAPPPPLTAEALHAARLAVSGRGTVGRWRFLAPLAVRGPARDAFPAAAVIFLLAFQEFEMAWLMNARSWTVWLLDARAAGLLTGDLLSEAAWPVACQAIVLAGLAALLTRGRWLAPATHHRAIALSRPRQAAGWLYASAAVIAAAVVPVVLLGGDLMEGWSIVLQSRRARVLEETSIALAFGAASGAMASVIAAFLLKRGAGERLPTILRVAGAVLLLPGLLGSLVVSLAVLWVFQREPLAFAYNSPLPAVVALVLFLLPRAMLLFLLVTAVTPQHALHSARLLAIAGDHRQRRSGRGLIWHLGLRRHVLAAGVVCIWGYLELLPASILAPADTRSAVVRLYEDMHYGRNAVLSTTALLVMLAPAVLWLLGMMLLSAATWCLGRFRGR